MTQMVEFMEYITEQLTTAIDIVKLLSLALSKIPHEKRLYKIYNYGITGQVCNWVEDFVGCRKQLIING